jgi:hypothetical protein
MGAQAYSFAEFFWDQFFERSPVAQFWQKDEGFSGKTVHKSY